MGVAKFLSYVLKPHCDEPCIVTVMSARSTRNPADIAADIHKGKRAAEAELVRRYSRPLTFIAQRATGDRATAEEICQEALLRAIVRLRARPLQDPDKLAAFLRGIAMGLIRNARRKAVRQSTYCNSMLVEEVVDLAANTPLLATRIESASIVHSAIASLPLARDRHVLTRYYLAEEDSARVCEDLGVPCAQFKSILYRARRRLRRLLEQKGLDTL